MSDKKAEGFEEWFDKEYGSYDKSNPREVKWVNETIKPLVAIPWNHLTEKHEKEIQEWRDSCDGLMSSCMVNHADLDIKLHAANEKLELLIKCDYRYCNPLINKCQGCKNKQLIDNEFNGSGE